jgi:alkylated DNA repair dioxygenase AlkB
MAAVTWQASLFGTEAPRIDTGGSEMVRTGLDRGAWVDHAPGWLAGSDTVFAELVDHAPWRQKRRRMYDRMVDEPRLTAWWSTGRDGDWVPPVLQEVRAALTARYGVRFRSIGCNLYRNGSDSVAWHGDTVRKTMAEPIVAIVSLGQPRRFLLRPRGGGTSIRYELGAGDLLVMGGTCQHTWEHSVPKARSAGPRLSVTFRHGA